MRDNKERESRGVKCFPFVCPPVGHSAIMLLLRGTSFVQQRVICIEMKKISHIFHIMYKSKTNMKSKTKRKRKHAIKL
jgi:hypothetical protein